MYACMLVYRIAYLFPAISMKRASYVYQPPGNPANITCILASDNFLSVAVYKVSPGPEVQLSQFHRNGSDVGLVSGASTRRAMEGGRLLLITSLSRANCEDSGMYECRHASGVGGRGKISIFGEYVGKLKGHWRGRECWWGGGGRGGWGGGWWPGGGEGGGG